ncbi:hypothetical protein [Clostridium scatologenes]|uniref:Uncharacterized protein n=1 Tax=Clostridium scatologenes TaxID=1548 RepID=A0A0E3M919_CLOSL|nr:hypothetical protein [Clostridium scatologenes]AKA69115.1 hypothetical protein CSCA_1990 [Clostridium scatologenes]
MSKIDQPVDLNKKFIRIGIISTCFAIVANFIPAIYLWIAYGAVPSGKDILKIWGLAAGTFGISWIVQPIAYYSILGTSGTYIAWLAGSVGDIRLPAVTMAQEVSGVEAGTEKGDVMSTMGVACSVLVSIAFITIFTFVGSRVLAILPKFVIDSFKYILPALFGAVYIEMSRKNIKVGIGTLVVGFMLMLIGGKLKIDASFLTIIIVLSGILTARVFHILDKNKDVSNVKK